MSARKFIFWVVFAGVGLAQTTLSVSVSSVVLDSSEAQAIKVSASSDAPASYSVANKPAWLAIQSANNYTAPDTLSFQLANSNCGTCTVTIALVPAGGGASTPVTVSYKSEGLSQMQATANPASVTLSNSQARSIKVTGPRGSSMEYVVKDAPPWLTVRSAHNFMTPDTLSFQLASSICGACRAALTLSLAAGGKDTAVEVTYDSNAGSSYRITPGAVSLTFPADPGTSCGSGYFSGCTVAMSSTNAAVTTYDARIASTQGGDWLVINNTGTQVAGAKVADGLSLAVDPKVAGSLAAGAYSGQVVVYNPANQSDTITFNVSLLLNPGKITISPESGTGMSQTFVMQFPHPAGWQSLSVVNLLISTELEPKHACYLAYIVPETTLALMDDAGNEPGPSGSVVLGKPDKIANSQCGVRLISAAGSGNTLTLTLNVTFTATFAGKKSIYLASRDAAQNNSGWLPMGTWEVRAVAPPAKKAPGKTGVKKK